MNSVFLETFSKRLLLWICVLSLYSCSTTKDTTVYNNLPTDSLGIIPYWQKYYYDLNYDGKKDFEFRSQTIVSQSEPPSVSSNLYIVSLDSNEVQCISSGEPFPFQNNTLISNVGNWSKTSSALVKQEDGGPWFGLWANIGERNLGLRLKIRDSYYYGWIKLYCYKNGYKIISSAFNNNANAPLYAGVNP